MKVKDFRELTSDMRRLVNDWHACVDRQERQSWKERASRFFATFMSASCDRATSRDLDDRLEAYREYTDVVMRKASASTPGQVSASRAATYNKSPGRAVRLTRAARGAMRRGYF